jgi:hypothetical protein
VSGLERFVDKFRQQGVDVEVPEVLQALAFLYWNRRDGKKKMLRADEKALTTHGAKVMRKRRSANKIAKATRKAQQRAAAKQRRKRQWRRKVGK